MMNDANQSPYLQNSAEQKKNQKKKTMQSVF